MFEKYFLGFLAWRAKTDDYQAAWQKSLIFTEKEEKENKQTTRPIHVRTFLRKWIPEKTWKAAT